MSTKHLPKLVTTLTQATHQITTYDAVIADSPALQARISQTHSWYAIKSDSRWMFAPSKFLRREFASGADYLAVKGHKDARPDGNRTEKLLSEWFEVVPPDTALGRELSEALTDFMTLHNKERRRGDRISIMKDRARPITTSFDRYPTWESRIVMDPAICGGRPTIRGTRMRVTDILEMLASGAGEKEIIADFDYLAHQDIAAALSYAALQIDHRVVRVA